MNGKSCLSEQAGNARAVWKKLTSLGLYLLPAVIILWVLGTGETQVYSLFQSPQSPVEAPTNTPEPAPVEVMPTDTPVPPPADTPVPPPTDTVAPPAQPTPEVIAPTEMVQPQAIQPATQPITEPVTSTLTQPPQATRVAPLQRQAGQVATSSGDSEVVVNQAKLIDTVVQGLAWGWICFGVIFLLLALALFPLLHLRGTYLKQNQK